MFVIRSSHIFLITASIAFLHLNACKLRQSSTINAFHTDKNSSLRRLADVGVYVDAQATTTVGEVSSQEFSSQKWTGDKMIDRDNKSYDAARHELLSPGGFFFVKAKRLQDNLLKEAPSEIHIIEGELVTHNKNCSQLFAGGESLATQNNTVKNPDNTVNTVNKPSDPRDAPRIDIKSQTNVPQIYNKNEVLNNKKAFTLCRFIDAVEKKGSQFHRANMPVYALALKPSEKHMIHIKIIWERLDNGPNALFDIKINNLNPREEYSTFSSSKSIAPAIQNCNIAAHCPLNPGIEENLKTQCSKMNSTLRQFTAKNNLDLQNWNDEKDNFLKLAKNCDNYFWFGTINGIAQPVQLNFSATKLNFYNFDKPKEKDFADLRLAKAIIHAFSDLKKSFTNITGIRYSRIYTEGATVAGSNRASLHSAGLAIDVSGIYINGNLTKVSGYSNNNTLKQVEKFFCQYFDRILGPGNTHLVPGHNDHFHLAILSESKYHYETSLPIFSDLHSKSLFSLNDQNNSVFFDEDPEIEVHAEKNPSLNLQSTSATDVICN
ncbi:MAG: extensin family protein [Bdellovibrionota bacterium]